MSRHVNPFVHNVHNAHNAHNDVSGHNEVSRLNELSDINHEFSYVDVLERGPESPKVVNARAPEGICWPRSSISGSDRIALFGLHGGAGTTTLTWIFGDDAIDTGQGWPVSDDGNEARVIAVARTHYRGLSVADDFTQLWGSGQLNESRLLGLILVDDAPRLVDSQQRAVKRLLKKTPRGAHVPWVENWRFGPPDPQQIPLRIRRIVNAFKNA